jgi:hypothetical protein
MSKIVTKKIVDDAAIVVEDVASMELDQNRLSALKRVMEDDSNATLRFIDGVWIYEVERVIPLNAEEWEKLAADVQAAGGDVPDEEIPLESTPTLDEVVIEEVTPEDTSTPVEIPEYSAIDALKDLLKL